MISLEGIPFPAATFYDAVVSRRVLIRQYEKVASTIGLASGFLLDIGTGPGWLAIMIASRNESIQVLGIDISAAMINLARRNARQLPNARFRVMNAARMAIPDSCMDLVVSTGSMHHWRKPELVFEEVHRVLKPGGRALLYDIRRDGKRGEILSELPRSLSIPVKLALPWCLRLHGFTRKSLEAELLPVLRSSLFPEWRVEAVGIWWRVSLRKE